jgi:hypothetical protein
MHAWDVKPVEATGRRYYEVVSLLVAAGAVVDPKWLADTDPSPFAKKVRADSLILAALRRDPPVHATNARAGITPPCR